MNQNINDNFRLTIESPVDKVDLKLFGPFIYERDIMGTPELFKFLVNHDYSVLSSMPQLDYAAEPWRLPDDRRTRREDAKVMKKAILNLFDPMKQEKAISLFKKGPELGAKVLKDLGFGFANIQGKKDGVYFFGNGTEMATLAPLSPKGDSYFTRTGKYKPMIPIERGQFKLQHGEWSHAIQVLAMIDGMSVRELHVFMGIYCGFFTDRPYRWAIWDILFDAPGNHFPNSPLWWRDRLSEP